MSWEVRKAKLEDATEIVKLAMSYDEFLMPYVLNKFVVRNYIDQFMVAEQVEHLPSPHYEVGGAVHYIDVLNLGTGNTAEHDRVSCFLLFVKQVPADLVLRAMEAEAAGTRLAFLGQIICPGKGSFYAILEELKSHYDELWCWMSVNGPSYSSYQRYGFTFGEHREFWNVYKCGYSTFSLGKWKKEK